MSVLVYVYIERSKIKYIKVRQNRLQCRTLDKKAIAERTVLQSCTMCLLCCGIGHKKSRSSSRVVLRSFHRVSILEDRHY